MKRLNVIQEDEDAAIIETYQKEHKIGTKDEAVKMILREWKASHEVL